MESANKKRSSRVVSGIMRRVRSEGSAPELRLRSALRGAGVRFRINEANCPGKPDIVIPSKKLAIFVDGDFWHGGQWLRRRLSCLDDQFKTGDKRRYWIPKIQKNMMRDSAVTSTLLKQGWRVLRFWESELDRDVQHCVSMIMNALGTPAKPNQASYLPRRTFAEFFAGIGLVRFALERQGWSLAFANDIDPKKHEMYSTHFGEENVFILSDIRTLGTGDLPGVTLATASFPCNDLSLAGGRKGLAGTQSSAFWGFVEVLESMAVRPPLVLIENVPGFLTSHAGRDLEQALLRLNQLAYAVDLFSLDAANFVPQSRARLFIAGISRACFGNAEANSILPADSDVRPRALVDFILAHRNIDWNIRSLPNQPKYAGTLNGILEDLPGTAVEWWSEERTEYLLNQMSAKHREIINPLICAEKYSYGTVFRRVRNGKSMAELRTDGIAGCLRTPRGGSGRQILVKAGFGRLQARLLTPRECARLMGAGDYKISVPLNQALFGFGDAVCVPAIEWIAENYLNPAVNEMLRGTMLSPPPS